jgi:aryl-alcohol dehydrogenase-like predicted oxidoreductase
MKLSLETSLKRLQTSYVDIFYVHVWDFTTSIPELMLGLNDLVRSGKVMYLGISGACMRAPYPIQRRICS